jgi:large subunit ribosomal protein L21e
MPSSHGTRRKSRTVMTKRNVLRGISYLLVDYHIGDKVVIDIDSREHTTTPHRRFQGRMGVVKEVGRRILKISVMMGEKQKILQVKFDHVKPLTQGTVNGTEAGEEVKN